MKRTIVIIIVFAVGSYFTYGYLQGKAEEKTATEKATYDARQKKREARHVAVAQLVSKYNAANDWEDKLRKGINGKSRKILTMELENLWLIDKPILFKGRIKDISNLDADNYVMTLNGSWMFNKLTLTLKSPKKMIDSFLSENPKATSGISYVAVIAKVNKIEAKYQKSEEGYEEEIRTGVGQCIDMLLYMESFFELR